MYNVLQLYGLYSRSSLHYVGQDSYVNKTKEITARRYRSDSKSFVGGAGDAEIRWRYEQGVKD